MEHVYFHHNTACNYAMTSRNTEEDAHPSVVHTLCATRINTDFNFNLHDALSPPDIS